MKGLQIIGNKGSGKSTLILKIGEILKSEGIKLVYIKNCHHKIKLNKKDEKFLENFSSFFLIDERGVFSFKKNFSLNEIFCQGGFFLVEGFKKENIFPKILCTRDEKDLKIKADYYIDIGKKGWEGKIKKILKSLKEEDKFEIEVFQGENTLPLKPFLKEMLKDILFGFFKNLKLKEEEWIKIYIKKI